MSKLRNIRKNINNYDVNELKKIADKLDVFNMSAKKRLLEKINIEENLGKYKFYPDLDDKNFYKKIHMKKEFYQNVYPSYDETDDDIQKKICPSKEKRFKLLTHQMFLKNYMSIQTPYKGVLLYHGTGSGKTCCFVDTPTILFNGRIKMVQDVKVGDLLMGDDSTPRKVLSLSRGKDTMYEICPTNGESFTVNSEHILCLKATNNGVSYVTDKRCKTMKHYCARFLQENCIEKSKLFETREEAEEYLEPRKNAIIEISVSDYLKLSNRNKRILKLYRTGVDFPEKKVELDPYILGLWLGDGHSNGPSFTNQESTILKYLSKELLKYDCYLNCSNPSRYLYYFKSMNKRCNRITRILKKYNLIKNKHIPHIYKCNSRENRLKLLAGLIDTDGYYNKCGYEIMQKNSKLSEDIVYLVRSLGFACYIKKVKKTCTNAPGGPKTGIYNKMTISGKHLDEIPVLCPRKKADKRQQIKDPLVTGFKVKEKGIDNYYGFSLDGNYRYLLGCFTITHNCSAISIAETYKKKISGGIHQRILVVVSGDNSEENFRNEIHDIHKGYNQCTFSDYQNYQLHSIVSDDDKIKNSKDLINKYYDITHYQKLTNIINNQSKRLRKEDNFTERYRKWISDMYSNRVIIIDEIHNLKYHGVKDEGKEKGIKRYKAIEQILRHSDNVKLILLSATPMGHSPTEIVDILNLLLVNDNMPKLDVDEIFEKNCTKLKKNGEEKLKLACKGYISYIRNENPYTFAKRKYVCKEPECTLPKYWKDNADEVDSITVSDYIRHKTSSDQTKRIPNSSDIRVILCEMGELQKAAYLTYVNLKKTNSVYLTQLGNIGHKNLLSGDQIFDKRKIYTIDIDNFEENNLQRISSKFYYLLKHIKKSPNGLIFIYSTYVETGVMMICTMLLRNGISLYESTKTHTSKKNAFYGVNSKWPKFKPQQPKKEDMLCYRCYDPRKKCKCTGIFEPMYFDYKIGTDKDLTFVGEDPILSIFRKPDNVNGKIVKILVSSPVLKEGISLLNIRQIHILEPWHNRARLEQIIGRGLRHCSHQSLDKKDRNVEIYHYASILSKKRGESKKINELLKEIEKKDQGYAEKKLDIDLSRSSENEEAALSYDILMYKRSEYLDMSVKIIEKILKESAIDCSINKKINIDTLDPKIDDMYKCYDGLEDEFPLTITEEDIDTSTYDNNFLNPYVQYVISLIKKYFDTQYILKYEELLRDENLKDDIYEDGYVIKKALYSIVPTDKTDFSSFIHIFKPMNKNPGYVFGRLDDKKNEYYIFQEFDVEGVRKRSDFEKKPMYERMPTYDFGKNFSLESAIPVSDNYNVWMGEKVGMILLPGQKSKIKRFKKYSSEETTPILKNCEHFDEDSDIVGISIEDQEEFKDNIWIRIKEKKTRNSSGLNACSLSRDKLEGFIKKIKSNIIKRVNDGNVKKIFDILYKFYKSDDIYKMIRKIDERGKVGKKSIYKLVKMYNKHENMTLEEIEYFIIESFKRVIITFKTNRNKVKFLKFSLELLHEIERMDNPDNPKNWFKKIYYQGNKKYLYKYPCSEKTKSKTRIIGR